MPAVVVRTNIRGLESANKNLQEIADMYGPRRARNVLRVPMRDAFRIVAEDISRTTPVDTGRLVATTNLRTRVPNRFDRRRTPGVVYVATAGWEFQRASGYWQQALAVEFGTSQVQPQRILTKALSRNAGIVVDEFARRLGIQVERAARRLAREQRRSIR